MKTSINLFAYFALNYNHNFIALAFESLGTNLVSHLQAKFSQYHKEVGGYGALIKFYVNLDLECQKLLENYITTNYKG